MKKSPKAITDTVLLVAGQGNRGQTTVSLLFRFNAPLVFFNAPHFTQQAQAAIDAAGPDLKRFVLDALPVTQVDVTAYGVLDDLAQTLRARGAELILAGRITETIELRKVLGIGESR